MRNLTTIALLLPLLAGCASLSKEECTVGDWVSVGANDAMEGRSTSRLSDHREACSKYNIMPDRDKYMAGYQKGLITYCTPSNGFSVGRNGYSYQNICPAPGDAEFMRGYLRGSALHEVETEIAQKEHELSRLREERRKLLAPKKHADGKKAPDKRKLMRGIERDISAIQFDLQQLQFKRDRALVDADEFLQTAEPGI
nr:DUF2799 domain-containing protein [uncultured Cohaesibacter sp.]